MGSLEILLVDVTTLSLSLALKVCLNIRNINCILLSLCFFKSILKDHRRRNVISIIIDFLQDIQFYKYNFASNEFVEMDRGECIYKFPLKRNGPCSMLGYYPNFLFSFYLIVGQLIFASIFLE